MKKITVGDKRFKPFIATPTIDNSIGLIASSLNDKFKGEKEPVLFVAVLNGAIPFAANLFSKLNFPVLFDTVKVSSYNGTERGEIVFKKSPEESVDGRRVIIAEDIIDSGETIDYLKKYFKDMGASEVLVASLLIKPNIYKKRHPEFSQRDHANGIINDGMYIGLCIDDEFVVGYGMDYNGLGRNLNKIYVLNE